MYAGHFWISARKGSQSFNGGLCSACFSEGFGPADFGGLVGWIGRRDGAICGRREIVLSKVFKQISGQQNGVGVRRTERDSGAGIAQCVVVTAVAQQGLGDDQIDL